MKIPLLLMALFLLACHPAQPVARNAVAGSLLFLTFRIKKAPDQAAGSVIGLLNKTTVAGKLKPEPPAPDFPGPRLRIDTYRKNKVVHTLFQEHPLYKRFEYADESGVLTAKNVELNEAEFFIRMPVQGDRIKISEIIPPAKEKALITVKL